MNNLEYIISIIVLTTGAGLIVDWEQPEALGITFIGIVFLAALSTIITELRKDGLDRDSE